MKYSIIIARYSPFPDGRDDESRALIEEKKNALIVNALFAQNVRGKSIPIIKIIIPRLCIKTRK